jgi:hypothetical protein
MLRPAVATVAILAATMGGSIAAPVTYACTPASSDSAGNVESADELVIDTAVPSLDLRVAASMQTDTPLNWLFTNRPDEGLGPDKLVMEVVFETTVGGGLRSSTSYAFILEGSDFRLTMMSTYGVETYRWTCSA